MQAEEDGISGSGSQPQQPRAEGASLNTDALAWSALLAKWLEYAQAAKALPKNAEGERWRSAVPHVVALQAVAMALRDLERVAVVDRAVARDRAGALIESSRAALENLWSKYEYPPSLGQLVRDALDALDASAYVGLTEVVWPGPGEFVMPQLHGAGAPDDPGGTMLVMAPGTIAFAGETVALYAERPAPAIAGTTMRPASELFQVYRMLDASAHYERTAVEPLDVEVENGLALLIPMWVRGQRIGKFLFSAEDWLKMQRAAGIGARLEK